MVLQLQACGYQTEAAIQSASTVSVMAITYSRCCLLYTSVTEVISAKIEDGALIFKPTKSAVNNYYKFIFDCQAGSKNGLIQVSKIADVYKRQFQRSCIYVGMHFFLYSILMQSIST